MLADKVDIIHNQPTPRDFQIGLMGLLPSILPEFRSIRTQYAYFKYEELSIWSLVMHQIFLGRYLEVTDQLKANYYQNSGISLSAISIPFQKLYGAIFDELAGIITDLRIYLVGKSATMPVN
jgi:hypothetical protein